MAETKVTNGDTVYILGDMAMRGTQEELIAFVSMPYIDYEPRTIEEIVGG